HELATNAAKYGALANDSGEVCVVWERADPNSNMLKLSWTETGGPTVQPPLDRGFGSRLIEEAFPHQLQGSAALSYDASGVSCTLVFSTEKTLPARSRRAVAATESVRPHGRAQCHADLVGQFVFVHRLANDPRLAHPRQPGSIGKAGDEQDRQGRPP